jgi:soluble lytic murein transglycosylase-like protein
VKNLLLILIAVSASAQSQQQSALERQRASVDRQRGELDRQRSSAGPMQASIDLQRGSLRKQVGDSNIDGTSFFSTSWSPASGAVDPVEPLAADCDPLKPAEIDGAIDDTAKRNGLTPDLLRALIQRESAFKPCAVSRKGAMGLMQLMPGTAADLELLDPFDPIENVRAGSQYLRQLLDRYGGDVMLALSAYNAGPARVDAAGGIPPIKETQNYVNDIVSKIR